MLHASAGPSVFSASHSRQSHLHFESCIHELRASQVHQPYMRAEPWLYVIVLLL